MKIQTINGARVAKSTARGVYAPRAVQEAAGVASMIRPGLAIRLGATEIRPADGFGFVATWPRAFFRA